MLIPIITTVGAIALTGWLGFLAARHLLPRIPSPAALRAAARDRVRADPLDHVRSWIVRMAPSRLRLQQRMEAAQATASRAGAREQRLLTTFKDGKEPSFAFTVTAITLLVLWIVSIVSAFLIDLPIIASVSGGNVLFGILGTLLLLGVPVIGSVLLGHFFGQWRSGELSTTWFSLVATVVLAIVVAVVALLTGLAPIRAEVEYADQLRAAGQQLAMYREDGDENAVRFTEQNLADLQAQQERSAEWNTALVPIAATAEFATGFFFPLAIPLLLLADAKTSRRRAERALTVAANSLTNQRARQYARLSARFQRLGLTQLELQQHLAAVNAENTRDATAATPIEVARGQVAGELLAQATAAAIAPAVSEDDAITAEIVTTDELPPLPPPVRPMPPRRPAPPGRPAPEPAVAAAPEPDLPDESFDLS